MKMKVTLEDALLDPFSNAVALELLRGIPKLGHETFNLKRFIPVQGYLSPNTVEVSYALHAFGIISMMEKDERVGGSKANNFCMSCWQAFHRWPMYAVTKELCEAMFLTDPPGDIKWGELQWPIAAATFLLPDTEQVRRELNVSKPVAISIGRLKKPGPNTHVTLDNLLGRVRMPDGSFERDMVCIFYMDDKTGTPMFHDVTAKPEWTLDESADKKTYRAEAGEVEFCDEDFNRMEKCVKLAVNFLCFMTSNYQPTVVASEEQPMRKSHESKRKKTEALYGVRWLGQGYRRKGPPLGGHHASPHVHWRRGHFRSQPFGPGRTQHRPIWIEPVMVSAEAEVKKAA